MCAMAVSKGAQVVVAVRANTHVAVAMRLWTLNDLSFVKERSATWRKLSANGARSDMRPVKSAGKYSARL